MTVSNIEPKNQAKEEQPAPSSSAIATKKDFIKKKPHNKYNNNRMRVNYNRYNSNTWDDYARYYPNQPLKPDYPMPYIYYYPPPSSMYYPPIGNTSNAAAVATLSAIIPATRDEDDLEIIVHDESMNNVSSVDTRRSSSSDQNKPIDLKKQLEFYFSRQNLVNDTFLVSQMNSDLYVPISLVANFRRVREWTTDVDLIVKILRDSSAVTVDESGTKVKPNISVQRNTVILRDVPDCTQDEIDNLLKELDSPPVQSIKQDIGNMWYFTFESEDDALKLLLSVRGKSFKGQAIAARMKSEPVLRVQSRAFAAAAASVSPSTNQNIKAEGQDQSATTATTSSSPSHEPSIAIPELPPVYAYNGVGMNVSNVHYPSYPSYNNNKRNNYGHVPVRYNNNQRAHFKYSNSSYQQQQQQQLHHHQPPSSLSDRHESRSSIDNQKSIQVGGRSARGGGYNTNKLRHYRNGPESNTADNVVENGLNKLTLNDTAPHPPSSQPRRQTQHNTQQRHTSTAYQNNKHQHHTKSSSNSRFTNNNNNSNIHHSQRQQQPNVPYTKPNYTTNDAAPSSNTSTATAATTTNTNRNSNTQFNLPPKQQQQQNKKKSRYSNNQQQHDNNSNTHHAGGGKIDNKKKKSNNKSATHEFKENTKQNKQEAVELKPTHFPPLPSQQPSTTIAMDQPTPPARSVADIVKSTVAPKPKKQMTEETPEKELQPVPPPTPPSTTTPTEQETTNTFSYADMLKKKHY